MADGIEIQLTGNVRRYDYDNVNKLQKIDLVDPDKNISFYIEVPIRIANLNEMSKLKVKIEPEKKQAIDFDDVLALFNSDLYSVKQTDDENKYFFSAGGLQFRIFSQEDLGFSMREQRQYKLIIGN